MSFTCHVCGVSAQTTAKLRHHIQRVHDERNFDCDTCGKTITGLQKFISHQKSHQGFVCPVCEKKVSMKNKSRHLKSCSKSSKTKVMTNKNITRSETFKTMRPSIFKYFELENEILKLKIKLERETLKRKKLQSKLSLVTEELSYVKVKAVQHSEKDLQSKLTSETSSRKNLEADVAKVKQEKKDLERQAKTLQREVDSQEKEKPVTEENLYQDKLCVHEKSIQEYKDIVEENTFDITETYWNGRPLKIGRCVYFLADSDVTSIPDMREPSTKKVCKVFLNCNSI